MNASLSGPSCTCINMSGRALPFRRPTHTQDLLFKPGVGASLSMLKVEIGGDTQSTDGTEPSHMHTRDDVGASNCLRGYEAMLLRGARARNPSIRTYALSWGIPHWPGNGSYFTADTIRYHVSWLQCVRDSAGVAVDALGVWNERSWGGVDYVVRLRAALDAAGFGTTGIVVGDDGGSNADDFVALGRANATFAAAVHAIGLHYPCVATGAAAVEALGWRYWASEDWWSAFDWAGAGCYARTVARNWVAARMTATVAWSLLWATYSDLPDQNAGLMQAQAPWSGAFVASPPLWAAAHYGQFTAAGWRLLAVGRGSGRLAGGGSYVGFVPPPAAAGGGDFTLVFETTVGACNHCGDAPAVPGPQAVAVALVSGLAGPGATLAVWASNATAWFIAQPDIVRSSGSRARGRARGRDSARGTVGCARVAWTTCRRGRMARRGRVVWSHAPMGPWAGTRRAPQHAAPPDTRAALPLRSPD